MDIPNTDLLTRSVSLIQDPLTYISRYLSGFSTTFWSKQGRAQSYLDYFLKELDPMLSQRRIAAEVVSIERETDETSTIILRPSLRWRGFKPGQYVALDIDVDGVRYRRNYSISCSPKFFEETGKFSITVKAVNKGKVSSFLNTLLNISAVVHVSDARGEFILPSQRDELKQHKPIFMAGGSGITPIRSMIDYLLEMNASYPEKELEEILLIHYAKNADDIIYQSHFEQLAEQHERFTYIHHFSDLDGNISAKNLEQDCTAWDNKSVYMCGPEGFMSAVREITQSSLSVSSDNIYSESFGGSQASFANVDAEVGEVNFAFAGRQVESNGKNTLLELAESAGLEPKFGCRSGICHECKCRRPEGRLLNRMTGQAISDDQTYVQSCITVPSGNLTLKQW